MMRHLQKIIFRKNASVISELKRFIKINCIKLMDTQTDFASEEVLQAIPHRPPFLFVDEVISMDDKGLIARRKLRAEESYYEGHYPQNPITPGVLLCESVFQAGAIFLSKRMQAQSGLNWEGKTPMLSRIKDAKF